MPATHWSDLTNYPKIYSHTYWGNFPIYPSWGTPRTNYPEDELIVNRNRFIDDFQIANRRFKHGCRAAPYNAFCTLLNSMKWADHKEFYTTRMGDSICIISQSSQYDAAAEDAGFIKIYPLYCQSQSTWMKVV